MMKNNQNFLGKDEKIYWQGEPVVPILSAKSIVFCLLPGVVFLLFWSGWIEFDKNNVFLQKANDVIQQNMMVRGLSLLLIIGLMISPIVRWFLYYKRIAYVFTERRAIAYYKRSNEIVFQIKASDVLKMKRFYRGSEQVSLYQYIQEEDLEDLGITRVVRVGFEGVPAHILDFY